MYRWRGWPQGGTAQGEPGSGKASFAMCEAVTPFPPSHQTCHPFGQQGFLWEPGVGKPSGPQKQDICPKAQVFDLSKRKWTTKGVVKQSPRWELKGQGRHRNGAFPWSEWLGRAGPRVDKAQGQ